MKQFLSGLVLIAAIVCGISTTAVAQAPSVVVAPISPTCAGTNTYLHYSATNSPTAYTITWTGTPTGLPDVPPGTPIPPTNIPITVLSSAAAGTYYGTLIVSNVSGASSPVSISVTVYSLPAVYTVTGGGAYCNGGTGVSVGLSGSETGVLYQLYHGGVGSGTAVWGAGSSITFGNRTVAGSYDVIGTNQYTGCQSPMSGAAVVSINPVPAVVSVTGGGGYCAGGGGVNVGLSASVFGTYYQLYRGSTAVGIPVPGIGMALDFGLQTAVGSYTVVAIDSAGPCTSNMSGGASVYIYPQPTVYNVLGGGSYCFGGYGVDVSLSGSNTGIVYKLFNNGSTLMGTLTGTGSAIDFGLQTPDGTYTVKATNSIYGCTQLMADTAHVSYIPDTTPSVSIAAPLTICKGNVDTFRAVTLNGGSAPVYQWTVNGAFVAYGNMFIYTPHNADVVKVTLTSNVTCALPATVTSSVNMIVKDNIIPTVVMNAYPSATIIHGTTENLSVAVVNGGVTPVYQWLVNGVVVAGANTATFSTSAFANGDSVTCLVYGCNDTPGHASIVIHVIPKAGVAQVSSGADNIVIMPNPSKGTFTVTGSLAGDQAALNVTDVLGKSICTKNVTINNGKVDDQVQLPSGTPAGMYLVTLNSGSEKIVSRIIIE